MNMRLTSFLFRERHLVDGASQIKPLRSNVQPEDHAISINESLIIISTDKYFVSLNYLISSRKKKLELMYEEQELNEKRTDK